MGAGHPLGQGGLDLFVDHRRLDGCQQALGLVQSQAKGVGTRGLPASVGPWIPHRKVLLLTRARQLGCCRFVGGNRRGVAGGGVR
jgi:hypothetical protein